MENPFQKLLVRPFIGDRLVSISWESPAGFDAAEFYVARSASASPGTWVVLNPDAPVTNGVDFFSDTDLTLPNPGETVYYKIRCVLGAESLNSHAVELFSGLSRLEFGMLASILSDEWVALWSEGGVEAWHCIPLASGTPNPARDPDTGTVANAACDPNFGMPFVGGFAPPVKTRVRLIQLGPKGEKDRADQMGTDRTFPCVMRFPSLPRPKRGHMIVLPGDQRYVVGETVTPYFFKGMVPIAWEAPMLILPVTDPRYKFEAEPIIDDGGNFNL